MSTRSFIARPTDGGFRGVYHHWDGYVTALGAALLRLHANFGGRTELLAAAVIDAHPAGWSTLTAAEFPAQLAESGFTEMGLARMGTVQGVAERRAAECYCHGDRAEEANPITCRCPVGDASGCDPLFLEWGYVLRAEGLDVYKSVHSADDRRHELIATLPWGSDMAAVAAAEEAGQELAEVRYQQASA